MGSAFPVSLGFMPQTVDGLPVVELTEQTVMVLPHIAFYAQYTGVFLEGNQVVVYVNGRPERDQTGEIALDAWHHVVLVAELLSSGGA
jgi:hypothetical protein